MAIDSLPVVRISDDGELGDVRSLLDQLGVDWVTDDEEPERATALWIANPRRLFAQNGDGGMRASFRIVVADKLTKTLQREVERLSPDFLVGRPVHPAALRLLILHALYVGPERRTSTRVAISAPVRFRTGVFARPAQLIELSRGGCRIVASRMPAVGEHVGVVLPRELIGDAALHLNGRIVATDPAGGWEPGEQACSIAFEDVTPETRRALRIWIATRTATTMHPRDAREVTQPVRDAAASKAERHAATSEPAAAQVVEQPAPTESEPGERRRSARRPYARPVLASSGGGARVLLGRDLSSGGMRVAPDSDLPLGAEFKLVIYGPAGRTPLLLRSRVLRDDGDAGCVLVFRDVPLEIAAELEEWTQLLPNLGRSEDGATTTGSIVSEWVDDADEAPASE